MPNILLVDKNGDYRSSNIKDFDESGLYKKCGFKKQDGFSKHTDWTIRLDGESYVLSLYGKDVGKANNENKYDFPPPGDNILLFGTCMVVCREKKGNKVCDLTESLWESAYEKLFGGFEDLASTAKEDDEEEDELANVPQKYKTEDGYLKDGFVVDDTEEDGQEQEDLPSEETSSFGTESLDKDEDTLELEDLENDLGSELDEEDYDYSSDEEEG